MLGGTKYIFVLATPDAKNNQGRFGDSIQSSIDILNKKGAKSFVIAHPQAWKQQKAANPKLSEANFIPMEDLEKFSQQVQKSLALEQNDTVVIKLIGHGLPTESPGKSAPGSGRIPYWGKPITYKEFGKNLGNFAKDANVKLKLLSTICFPGVHSMVENIPRACSAANTIFTKKSEIPVDGHIVFETEFWQQVESSPSPVFAEVTMRAIAKDLPNSQLGNLSSTDFMNQVLQEGPYTPAYLQSLASNTGSTTPLGKVLDARQEIIEPFVFVPNWGKSCGLARFDEFKVGLDLESFEKILAKALGKQDLSRNSVATEKDKTFYEAAVSDLRRNSAQYDKDFKSIEKFVRDLEVKQKENSKIEGKDPVRFASEQAKLNKRYQYITKYADEKLSKYFLNLQIVKKMGKLKKFADKASEDQKKKLRDLLECEWETLGF